MPSTRDEQSSGQTDDVGLGIVQGARTIMPAPVAAIDRPANW